MSASENIGENWPPFLGEEPLFQRGRGLAGFEDLLAAGRVEQLDAGAILVSEGQLDTDMFILLEGDVEVLTQMQQDWLRVAVLGPGSVIGEMAFLDDLPRSARVIARTPIKVMRITREYFQGFARRKPERALAFVLELGRVLAFRLRRLNHFDAAEVARERERKYLAAELHDQTLADLASMGVELGFLSIMAKGTNDEMKTAVAGVRERLKTSETRLREIVQGIYPQTLSTLGLVPALDSYLTILSSRPIANPTSINVTMKVKGFDSNRLPEEIEIEIYRLVQQGVANVIQHAQARNLKLDLDWSEAGLTVIVADDGIGFDVEHPGETPSSGHFGLGNLRNRVERSLGSLKITSKLDRGTILIARIPTASGELLLTGLKEYSYVFDPATLEQEAFRQR